MFLEQDRLLFYFLKTTSEKICKTLQKCQHTQNLKVKGKQNFQAYINFIGLQGTQREVVNYYRENY